MTRRIALLPLILIISVLQVAGWASPAAAVTQTGTLTGLVAFGVEDDGDPTGGCSPFDFGCVPSMPGMPGGMTAGDAVPGVTVEAYNIKDPKTVVATTTTGSDGTFSIQVPTTSAVADSYLDEFYLRFSGEAIDAGWFVGGDQPVVPRVSSASTAAVWAGNTVPVGNVLVATAGSTGGTEPDPFDELAGTVVTAAGVPVAGADITVWHFVEPGTTEIEATDVSTTDASGSYDIVLADPIPGDVYTVTAAKAGITRFAGSAADVANSWGVILNGLSTFEPITLPLNSLSGAITAPAGTPVEALVWDGKASAWVSTDPISTTVTDTDGHWAFTGISTGTYTVRYAGQIYANGLLLPPDGAGSLARAVTPTSEVVLGGVGTLPAVGSLTGTLRPGGSTATAYRWDGANWIQVATTTSDASTGAYSVPAVAGTYALRFSGEGVATSFLGGGTTLPAGSKSSTATVTVTGSTPTTVPTVELAGTPGPDFGTVAGQASTTCTIHTLTGSTPTSVTLPFAVKVAGTSYTTAFISRDGFVSLGAAETLSGGEVTHPTFAPFGAPSGSAPNGGTVTWGTSATGLCVVWSGIGGNTFQLLLTLATGAPGRQPGDADLTFNYDRVASATSVVQAGVWLSGTEGWSPVKSSAPADVTDSALRPLVTGSLGSATPGRYLFTIANPAPVTTGSLTVDASDVRSYRYVWLADTVFASACRVGTTTCSSISFGTIGGSTQTITGLAPGQYAVTWYSYRADNEGRAGDELGALIPATVVVTVTAGGTVTAVLGGRQAEPIPESVTVPDHGTTNAGEVRVGRQETISQTASCAGGTATYSVYSNSTGTTITGTMKETAPKTYTADVPDAMHGSTQFTFTLVCPGATTTTTFDVYIDPSGTVVDQYGLPIAGATVVLQRSDTYGGIFTDVPDGSTIMSPANRLNPWTTPADGGFAWDVTPGYYTVSASKPGCETATTDVMQVPVERTEIVLKLQCTAGSGGSTPTPKVTGTASVGGKLAVAAQTPTGFVASYQWRRNGTAIKGATQATYVVTRTDAGTKLTAVVGYQRAAAPIEAGSETLVSFARLSVTTATTTVKPLAVARVKVSAKGAKKSAKVTVNLTVAGLAAARTSGVVTVTVSGAKPVTVKIVKGKGTATVKKLKKGKHTLTAVYAGSTTAAAAKAAASVKVT